MSHPSASSPAQAPPVRLEPPVPEIRSPRAGRLQRALKGERAPGVTRMEHYTNTMMLDADSVRVADPVRDSELIDVHRSVCKMAAMKPGKLLVVDSRIPNAAFMGNGTMSVTTGLMKILNRPELETVIAHELGHRKHRFKHQFLPILVTLGAMALTEFGFRVLGSRDGPRSLLHSFSEGLTTLFVGSLAGKLFQRWRSQKNELESDEEAVRITKNPDALASAFQKLEKRSLRIKQKQLEGKWEYLAEREAQSPAIVPDLPEEDRMVVTNAKEELHQQLLEQRAHQSHPATDERVNRLQPQKRTAARQAPQGPYTEREHAAAAAAAAFGTTLVRS